MTSGVLTDTDRTGPDPAPPEVEVPTTTRADVADVVRRRLARSPMPGFNFWVAALLTTAIGAVLRLINLSHPKETIFDEVYYANEAHDLLTYGVEWNPETSTPQYVVHPPLGKWMIGVGEHFAGFNSFGWRISAVVVGVLSILMVVLIAQRLFRSTILACTAGLLMSLDGMHFVLSRAALLDIFLMFFIVMTFGFLVLDREQRRARWLAALEAGLDTERLGSASRPRLGVPWWRIAAGISIGVACGVKWSALWYLIGFAVLILLWEGSTRRSAGARRPWRDTLLDETPWVFLFGVLAVVAYIGTWYGWFVSDDGYFRHWYAETNGLPADRFIDPLVNLMHYHQEAYNFHTGLTSKHQYQSWPWQWLLLGRPVAFYWSTSLPCGGSNCAAEILLLGTPVLWWAFLPALVALAWLGISRRDWRAGAIGLGVFVGIVPWFSSMIDSRTMFYFYALPAEPFLVLAVVYVLGAIIGPPRHVRPNSDRRLIGTIIAGAFVLLVAACFAYFYPIYAGRSLPYVDWFARMWLGSRWV